MSDFDHVTRIRTDLKGVSETLLGNLKYRALAASGSHPVLHDPKAIELVERIDYPFHRFVGDRTGQWHALRVRRFDTEIRRFLTENPKGTIIALGEGLETQFWRVDNGEAHWLTVDLPEAIALRRQLLPDGPRQHTLTCSATDPQWLRHVDTANGVLVTAQGLLMYFQLADVCRLVEVCAEQFPGQTFLFDAVPAWLVNRQRRSDDAQLGAYNLASWIWGFDAASRQRLAALTGVADLTELQPIRGHGILFGLILPIARKLPQYRKRGFEFPILRMRFA